MNLPTGQMVRTEQGRLDVVSEMEVRRNRFVLEEHVAIREPKDVAEAAFPSHCRRTRVSKSDVLARSRCRAVAAQSCQREPDGWNQAGRWSATAGGHGAPIVDCGSEKGLVGTWVSDRLALERKSLLVVNCHSGSSARVGRLAVEYEEERLVAVPSGKLSIRNDWFCD